MRLEKNNTGVSSQNSIALDPSKMKKMMQSIMRIERPMYYASVIPLVIMLIALILQNIFRGAKLIDSIAGVDPCSAWYWVIIGIYTLFGLALFTFSLILARHHSTKNPEYGYGIKYDFNISKILLIVFFGWFSGALSSFVGIGVWIVMHPLMLFLGFPQHVCIYLKNIPYN